MTRAEEGNPNRETHPNPPQFSQQLLMSVDRGIMDADDEGDGDRPPPLSSLISSWKDEQNLIASSVVVPPDKSKTYSMIIEETRTGRGYSGRFRLVHPTLTSFATTAAIAVSDGTNDGTLLVGGVDVHYHDGGGDGDDDMAVAAYVILEYDVKSRDRRRSRILPSPVVVHRSHKWYRPAAPYVPSYLAYREMDPLIELINDHKSKNCAERLVPSVIFVDGNGMWHERNAGLACFVGVKTGLPTVGVGKAFYCLDGTMTKQDVRTRANDALHSWYDEITLTYAWHINDERIGMEMLPVGTTDRCLVLDAATTTATSTPPAATLVGKRGREAKLGVDVVPVERILEMLHRYACGIAIPMKRGRVTDINYKDDDENKPLAYALVGHGGNDNIRPSNCSRDPSTHGARRGSVNPIYISVGSNISLLDAVNVCSSLCVTRIPEPIREADMYCRRLVRERRSGS
jgi:deoxyinosine 3'endonuclease (endonuclease V)